MDRTPPLSILTVFPKMTAAGQRVFLSQERRPLVCYGFDVILNDASTGRGLTASPYNDGFPPDINAPGAVPSVFVSFLEWLTMHHRVSRYPVKAANASQLANPITGRGPRVARPYVATAPFLVDLSASYVFNAVGGKPRIGIQVYYTSADPVHLRQAGLQMPTAR